MNRYLLSLIFSLVLLSPLHHAEAAALTVGQVSAIIGLLQAFGADASVIANVRAALGGGSGGTTTGTGGPTASFTVNGQTSATNVDPLMSRTWAWSSTGGSSYNASVVISGCDDSRQNGSVNPWTPWTFGTGTAANGSASPAPGAGYYGCTASASYRVTNSAGQSATANASVMFKHAGGTSGGSCSYTAPAMPATQGTTDASGKYHFPPNIHIATLAREFPTGPKSFSPTMQCTVMDLDSPNVQGAQSPANSGASPTVEGYNGHNLLWVVPKHGCISVKFTTGNKLAIFEFVSEMATIAPLSTYFFNISRNPGDFDYTNFTNNTGGSSGTIAANFYAVGDTQGGADTPGSHTAYSRTLPRLETNTTYYINIRNETLSKTPDPEADALRGVDICPYQLGDGTPVGGCGGLFQVRYTEEYRDSSGQIVAGGPVLPPSPNSCPGSVVSVPTARITVNGQKSVTVKTGDALLKAWSSTNGSSYDATWSATGATCKYAGRVNQHWNGLDGGAGTTGTQANGTESYPAIADQAGCTFTITYTVTSASGQKASDSIVMTL